MQDNVQSSRSPSKEKTTFNLSKETLNKLEDLWLKLRPQFKGGQRITKTLIVEKAIDIIIFDYEKRTGESALISSLKK